MVIGIGGMSRSGKTTLASRIKDHYSYGPVVIHNLDDFAVDESEIPMIRHMIDWEHPDSINFEKLYQVTVESCKHNYLVIVEGFLIYHYPLLTELIDKKICVTITKDEFERRRRIQYQEPQWYLDHIWDSYYRYQGAVESQCNIVIDGNSEIDINAVIRAIEW